jgi:hypothetical protein
MLICISNKIVLNDSSLLEFFEDLLFVEIGCVRVTIDTRIWLPGQIRGVFLDYSIMSKYFSQLWLVMVHTRKYYTLINKFIVK